MMQVLTEALFVVVLVLGGVVVDTKLLDARRSVRPVLVRRSRKDGRLR
jgi:hypothetical protein